MINKYYYIISSNHFDYLVQYDLFITREGRFSKINKAGEINQYGLNNPFKFKNIKKDKNLKKLLNRLK